MLLGAPGCANYFGTTAASFMRHVEQSPDPNIRHRAYTRLADPLCYTGEAQKDQAVDVLSAKLAETSEPTASRAQICRTLGDLERPAARAALIRAVEDEDPLVRAEACRALGKVGTSEDAAILSRIMAADTSADCRLAAIEGLGALRTTDLRVMEQLVKGMEHEDPGIRLACFRALKTLTDEDYGPDPRPWQDELASRQALARRMAQEPRTAPARR